MERGLVLVPTPLIRGYGKPVRLLQDGIFRATHCPQHLSSSPKCILWLEGTMEMLLPLGWNSARGPGCQCPTFQR